MMPEAVVTAAVFAAVYALLSVGHHVGDHWGQRSVDAVHKQAPGLTGAVHCAIHVAMNTGCKLVFLVPGLVVLGLPVSVGGVVLGLGVDAMSHYVVDRGRPLRALAHATGNASYITRVTVVRTPGGPADDRGPGTGAYELDQAWHRAFVLVAALIIAGVSA